MLLDSSSLEPWDLIDRLLVVAFAVLHRNMLLLDAKSCCASCNWRYRSTVLAITYTNKLFTGLLNATLV
jgi:hypothetical protein